MARNAWAPPRATTDLDVTVIADRPRDRDDVSAVVRTQTRAGRELDWSHVERWATFWRIEDRLRRLLRNRDA